MPSTEFEKKACPRCGGSGHYSFNLMTGSRCFQCHGNGKVLTKRGQAAYQWLMDQRKVRAVDIPLGRAIRGGGYKRLTVRSREVQNNMLWLSNDEPGLKRMSLCTGADALYELLPASEEERVAQLRAAFAYQDTLGENGRPLRRTRAA